VADLARVGREAVALGEGPACVGAPQRQRAVGLHDADRGDVGGLQALEQRLAEHPGVRRLARALVALVEQRRAAQDDEQHDEYRGNARAHACRRRRTSATTRPAIATRSGMSAMFSTLVQKTRLSASWRRFLRTSLSSRRVSATVFLKRSSSACCSGVRIWPPFAAPPWAFCSSCSFAVVFCSSFSSAWILPKYCFCASASSSRTTVSGRKEPSRLRSEMSSSPAASCSTMPSARARLPLEGTTTLRPNTSWTSTAAPSASMSTSATRITEFSFADSRSCGVPATGFLSTSSPSGNAVLKVPVRRSASGIARPEGLKLLVASSPDFVASALLTSIELGELFTSSVALRPAAGLTSNAPPKA